MVELTRSAEGTYDIRKDIELALVRKVVEDPSSLIADNDTVFQVYFDTAIDTLDTAAIDKMKEIIRSMKKYKASQVKLLGHTDSDGKEDYNLDLSQGRVNSVYNYLIEKGYPAHRILMSYHGESIPAANNATSEGKQLNRRVELRFELKK